MQVPGLSAEQHGITLKHIGPPHFVAGPECLQTHWNEQWVTNLPPIHSAGGKEALVRVDKKISPQA